MHGHDRISYLDSLKVLAAFCVIFIHAASDVWHKSDVYSLEYCVINIYEGLIRWCVPAFAMISGAVFIRRDIPLRVIFIKYIFRIFTAFIFWSVFYALIHYHVNEDFDMAVTLLITGYFHMWYLPMTMALYAVIPFMKLIAKSESLTKYFLVLSLIAFLAFPQAINATLLFSGLYGNILSQLRGNFYFSLAGGFTGYFLLGYVLSVIEIDSRLERMIYAFGIAGFIMTVILAHSASVMTGEPDQRFYDAMNIHIMLVSAAVFVYFRMHDLSCEFMSKISRYSMGAYLIHAELLRLARLMNVLSFCPLIAIPVVSLAVLVISYALSALLNQISFVNKYIV
ncbi:MAG: acyltransferase family protein [Synergistaceae bacterium]|nr:acyltransferase family protein [Synergistaceae bacterium]